MIVFISSIISYLYSILDFSLLQQVQPMKINPFSLSPTLGNATKVIEHVNGFAGSHRLLSELYELILILCVSG